MKKKYTHKKRGHTLTLTLTPMTRTEWWKRNGWYLPSFLKLGSGYLIEREFANTLVMYTWASEKSLSKEIDVEAGIPV